MILTVHQDHQVRQRQAFELTAAAVLPLLPLHYPRLPSTPCRSLAPTAVKKRKITQRIMALAVEHQFVTPLTALLVESQDATERLLADSPKDPKHGCCAGGVETQCWSLVPSCSIL